MPGSGSLLAFEIEANAFCHQMVRSLVGTLVDVGRGRKRPSDMMWILRSADRQQASQPAPPQGLTLMAVRYDWLTGLPARVPFGRILGGRRVGPRAGASASGDTARRIAVRLPPTRVAPHPRCADTQHHRTRNSRAHVLTQTQPTSPVPGASSTPTAWCSAVWPPRWPAVLRGKHKPIFAPNVDTGDHVIVINADKVVLTSGKAESKLAYRHSGYPGGLTATRYSDLMIDRSDQVVRNAITRHAAEEPAGAADGHQAQGLRRSPSTPTPPSPPSPWSIPDARRTASARSGA